MFSAKKKSLILAATIIALPSLVAVFVFWRLHAAPKSQADAARRLRVMPKIILWAWERPEDLTFLDTRETGVAILTATIQLKGSECIIHPRMQPVKTPKDVFVVAVTRIESSRDDKPTLSDEQRQKIIARILEVNHNPRVAAVQIDFDAKQQERDFYRRLLSDLREQLPQEMPLSMTALASWCLYDGWIRDLPVDEAVPMLFRMGLDANRVRRNIEEGGDFRLELARQSFGISTDEPLSRLPAARRVYIFCPRGWTKDAAQKIIQEVKQWQ